MKKHEKRVGFVFSERTTEGLRMHLRRFVLFVFVASVLTACATADESEWDPFKLVWPLPPEKPRVRYVDSLRSSFDVSPPGFAATVFGEARGDVLRKPYFATSDELGRIYVSDVGRIFVFDKANHKLTFIGDRGRVRVIRPLGMFYDKTNKLLYVADSQLDQVLVFYQNGKFLLAMGKRGQLKNPGGVAVDITRKRVYVTNTGKHVITVFDTEGHFVQDIGKRGSKEGDFNFPTQLALDKEGNLCVVDSGNFRVQILDPEGKVIRAFGEVGVNFGQFARPKGIALDPDGHIYVTDAMFHGVSVFRADGQMLLAWGQRGRVKGLFDLPAGIHIDEKGMIYVVSQFIGKVDIFQYLKYPEDEEEASGQPEAVPVQGGIVEEQDRQMKDALPDTPGVEVSPGSSQEEPTREDVGVE